MSDLSSERFTRDHIVSALVRDTQMAISSGTQMLFDPLGSVKLQPPPHGTVESLRVGDAVTVTYRRDAEPLSYVVTAIDDETGEVTCEPCA